METNITDTPRTDEAIEAMGLAAFVVPVEICRQLEMELNVSLKNQLEVQAEVERLREQAKLWHQHYRDKASNAQKYKGAFIEMEKKVESLRRALEFIACPERPDGTYNRDRRACEVLAREALAEIK